MNVCIAYTIFRGKTKEKPEAIHNYNKYMLGVDKLDQLMSYYSFLHKSVKWWRKVFFWMVEMCVVNSYIIFQQTMAETNNSFSHSQHISFRQKLITSLTEPLLLCRAQTINTVVKSHRLNHKTQHYAEKQKKRRDCVVCSSRTNGERHLTAFICTKCIDEPALCPGQCFKMYHTNVNYK